MNEAILSVNGEPSARVPLDDQQHSMFAQVGDYQITVRASDDVTVDISHKSIVPCAICGHEMMEIKPGHWACPGFYGSPIHFCEPGIFTMRHMYDRVGNYSEPLSDEDKKFGEMKATRRLEVYCGCTLEEYLAAREQLTESLAAGKELA